uniref:metabolite traffic protein EboE n=1 Tax=Cellvibrio fontiphilus TaxID=1815559 RepID=UPI002B4BE8A3|nr:metabolite traffic protein EboE [Cellvibrio fontiphilus]
MRQLTYCSNIHPGESWQHVLDNLESHGLSVKQQFSPHRAFPLGLRIAQQASVELDEQKIAQFRNWCEQHNCYLLTINGFPYGTFHDAPVKAAVYEPDWRTQERVSYTRRLGDLAVALATHTSTISISTVPIAFKEGFEDSDWPVVRANLLSVLEHLQALHQRSGILVRLALEPEPCCVLETTEETIEFFARMNFPAHLQNYIGICFDCCHQAVEFESAADVFARLHAANIIIAKVQVSSALRAQGEEIAQLIQFNEPVYLHQAVAKNTSGLKRFSDLPQLQAALDAGEQFSECRVHFHVPIFIDHLGACGTTQFFLRDFLPLLDKSIPLEVETYSFKNLPAHLRDYPLDVSIARELQWLNHLLEQNN